MIFYRSDWTDVNGVPQAMADLGTRNTSFRRLALLYRKLGIKNDRFHLALTQPSIAKYDPHNLTDPSIELRMKIAHEASINPWYYLREVVRIGESGGNPSSFQAHRANIAMAWCFYQSIDYIAIQARQTGKEQPLRSKLKTPTGWLHMGDVRVGSVLLAPDGTSTQVTEVFPQGVKNIYRITFEDGRTAECGEDHLWDVYDQNLSPNTVNWETISLKDILTRFKISREGLYIPRAIWDTPSQNFMLQIKSIRLISQEEAQCITVDHPSNLYVTDNEIVTHNTIGAITIESHLIYLAGRNMEIAMITKDSGLLQANVSRLKGIRDELPEWMIFKQSKDSDNKEGVIYSKLNNIYSTHIGNMSPRAADKVGRGLSVPDIHYDEPPWINNFKVIWDAAKPAMSKAGENARKNGMPSATILTTTASRIDTPEGSFTYELVQGAMPFSEKLYDQENHEQTRSVINNNSVNGMVNGTFSYLQLGKTHAWFIQETKNIANKSSVDHDYLNMWKTGVHDSALSDRDIKRLKSEEGEPVYVQITPEGLAISWYITEEEVTSTSFKNRKIIWGTDSSQNVGVDFTTFVGVDTKTLKTVGTFRCNTSRILSIAFFIGFFLVNNPGHTWIPEAKSTGSVMIETVCEILKKHGINPFTRIFNYIIQRSNEETFGKIDITDMSHLETSVRKYMGFMTSGRTRPYLFGKILSQAVRLAAEKVFDRTIVMELSGLSVRNGRIDHDKGSHDDSAVAWLLCFWFIFEGKHLHKYGFKEDDIISLDLIDDEGKSLDPEYVAHQKSLRSQIHHYEKLISETSSPMIKQKYSQIISDLKENLDDAMTEEVISVNKVSKSISNAKSPQTVEREREFHSKAFEYINLLS
jgi:hypothetical protein